MGLLGTIVRSVLLLPFVVGLYVLGTKPSFAGTLVTAYDSRGVLGATEVLVGAPDVLGVAALAVIIALIDPDPVRR